MSRKLLDFYRREWPRVGVVAAMAIGGGSLLASRKKQINLRELAVMNSMTMAAHQFEEYVEPGTFPGHVNRDIFQSDHPRNWPFNANAAMVANSSFTALYIPPMLFPKVKWLALPPAVLGIVQAVAHGVVAPVVFRRKYSPGVVTGVLLHLPIGVKYIQGLREDGTITRGDWIKTLAVLAVFFSLGVATPNISLADKNSPHRFTNKQMGASHEPEAEEVEGESL